MPTKQTTTKEIICSACSDMIDPENDASEKIGREWYCYDCYVICQWCDDRISGKEANCANDGYLCDSCYKKAGSCKECGDTYREDELVEGICESCEDDLVYPYRRWKHNKDLISNKKGAIVDSVRTFGLEIEVGYQGSLARLNTVSKNIHEDIGIAADSGAEFQTPPASGDKAEAMIHDMCAQFKKQSFTAGDGQGLHVHIGCPELAGMSAAERFKTIQGLWLFYIVFDKSIRLFTNRYRQNSAENCGGMFDKNCYAYTEVRAAKNERDLERIWYENDDYEYIQRAHKSEQKDGSRYRGVNMHSLFYDRHIEIRYHESVTEARPMLEWANLHCLIMDKAVAGIPLDWLDEMKKLKMRRKSFFKFLGLSTSSRRYFRHKARNK